METENTRSRYLDLIAQILDRPLVYTGKDRQEMKKGNGEKEMFEIDALHSIINIPLLCIT